MHQNRKPAIWASEIGDLLWPGAKIFAQLEMVPSSFRKGGSTGKLEASRRFWLDGGPRGMMHKHKLHALARDEGELITKTGSSYTHEQVLDHGLTRDGGAQSSHGSPPERERGGWRKLERVAIVEEKRHGNGQ